ncbi:ankyrin repeat domain-containing protein [Streptomyces sp. NPDC052682]|uniref:ankyrin repeat domain-containing protein n=1 Tax=Streptomyces sp. NPDC052682 TaxID=3154954 RepID=UPI00343C45EF
MHHRPHEDSNQDANEWTPAHKAVEGSDYEALSRLLDSGVDPNERCFGHTLLTHAIDVEGDGQVQTGHPLNTAATAILLAYGADPELPADSGDTPLQIAESYHHEPALRLLRRFLERSSCRPKGSVQRVSDGRSQSSGEPPAPYAPT